MLPCELQPLRHTVCPNHMLIYTECIHCIDQVIPSQEAHYYPHYHFNWIVVFGSVRTVFVMNKNIEYFYLITAFH